MKHAYLYILDEDHNIVPVYGGIDSPEYLAATKWLWGNDSRNRIVAQVQDGEIMVSTIFLGIDHAFGNGPPVLFETMIFGEEAGDLNGYQERCCTWDEAVEGHSKAVRLVTEYLTSKKLIENI